MTNIKYFEVSLEYKLQNGLTIKTKEYYDTLYDISDQFNININQLQYYYCNQINNKTIDKCPITSIEVVDYKPPIKVEISDFGSIE